MARINVVFAIIAIVLFAVVGLGAASMSALEQVRLLAGGLVFLAASHLSL